MHVFIIIIQKIKFQTKHNKASCNRTAPETHGHANLLVHASLTRNLLASDEHGCQK